VNCEAFTNSDTASRNVLKRAHLKASVPGITSSYQRWKQRREPSEVSYTVQVFSERYNVVY